MEHELRFVYLRSTVDQFEWKTRDRLWWLDYGLFHSIASIMVSTHLTMFGKLLWQLVKSSIITIVVIYFGWQDDKNWCLPMNKMEKRQISYSPDA